MRFLCLAYGAEADWKALSQEEQERLLAQDDVLRRRGAEMAVLEPPVTVQAPGGRVVVTPGPFASARVPLVGFGLIEAESLDEAVALVAGTPCPNTNGAVEIRPLR